MGRVDGVFRTFNPIFQIMRPRSGLGYLIIESRNAGNCDDLVIAGMIIIGLVGLKGFEHSYPRALRVKPEIFYMDEPFSALDALTDLRMRTGLLRILQEERHSVLLITDDVESFVPGRARYASLMADRAPARCAILA